MDKYHQEVNPLIDNCVINALWHSIFDVLDRDGMRSIFSYAELPVLTKDVLGPGKSELIVLLKILMAMRDLLQFSPSILMEIGRKFSFYLDPNGSNLKEFVDLLNKLMVTTKFDFDILNPNELIIGIEANVGQEQSSLLTDEWLLIFYQGLFMEAIFKAIGGNIKIDIDIKKHNCCRFKIQSDNEIKVQ